MNTYSVKFIDCEVRMIRIVEVEAVTHIDVYAKMFSEYKIKDTSDILKIRCHTKKEIKSENV